MKQRLQRILSILCVLALVTGCLILPAFAEEDQVIKTVTVLWNDGDDYEGLRPKNDESITMKIGGKDIILNESNNWSGETTAPAGATWTLADVAGYTPSTSGTDMLTVTYYHPVIRNKTWPASVSFVDGDNAKGVRPASVRICLLADGNVFTTPVTLNVQNGSASYTWSNLPLHQKGSSTAEITYSVAPADPVEGYTASGSSDTVTYTLQTTSLQLNVELGGAPDGTDLSQFAVTVDGPDPEMPQTISNLQNGENVIAFNNILPGAYIARVTNADFIKDYSIDAKNTKMGDGTFAESDTTGNLKVKYTWKKTEAQEPNEAPLADAGNLKFEIIGPNGYTNTVSYSEFEDGKLKLNNLAPGTYVVIERNPEDLVKAYNLTSDSIIGMKITIGKDGSLLEKSVDWLFNQYKQAPLPVEGKVDIPVVKIWNDNDNKDGNRPGSIKVILYANGTPADEHTLTAAEGWRFTFKDLEAYDENGEEIVYTVKEEAVEWYTADISGTYITNNYQPEVTSASVVKVWDDNDNARRIRPSTIAVTLLPVGDVYILSAENGWSATANNLPTKIDGKAVSYSWTEQEVVGYVSAGKSVSGSATIFTNRAPEIPRIPEDLPQPKLPGETWFVFEEYDTALGGEILINHVGDCFD